MIESPATTLLSRHRGKQQNQDLNDLDQQHANRGLHVVALEPLLRKFSRPASDQRTDGKHQDRSQDLKPVTNDVFRDEIHCRHGSTSHYWCD